MKRRRGKGEKQGTDGAGRNGETGRNKKFGKREKSDVGVKITTDTFNEKLLIETRRIERSMKEVLHMTDMWSRLTISAITERTTPDVLAETIRELWTMEFGTPKMIMGEDNGRITTGEIARIMRLFGVRYVRVTMQIGEPDPYKTGEQGHRMIDPDYPTRLRWGYL